MKDTMAWHLFPDVGKPSIMDTETFNVNGVALAAPPGFLPMASN
jgi:hypothetical protein